MRSKVTRDESKNPNRLMNLTSAVASGGQALHILIGLNHEIKNFFDINYDLLINCIIKEC